MKAVPPVEVPAAKRPRRSRATAPTVPASRTDFHLRAYRGTRPLRIRVRLSLRRRRDSGVAGSYRTCPIFRAKAVASDPTSRTWGVPNTSRATRIGFFTSSMAATPPASRSASIRAASIWMRPSIRMRDPVPALSLGSSSRTTIDSTTASSALPPRRRTAIPTSPAAEAASRTDAFEPAPQCVRRSGCTRLPGPTSRPSSFANSRLRRLRERREAGLQIGDPTSELVANRTQFLHRLSGRTGNRPVLSFVLRADRTSVEASERHDPRRAGDHLQGHRPRGLRAEADSDLLEQIDDHRVDRRRGLDSGALGPPAGRRGRVEQGLRQHAPKRVLDADEQDRRHGGATQSTADQIAWLLGDR